MSNELARDSAQLAFASSLTRLVSEGFPTGLSHFANLRSLDLRLSTPTHDPVIPALSKLTSLDMQFSPTNLSTAQLPDFTLVGRRLRNLSITWPQTADTYQALGAELAPCTSLRSLTLAVNISYPSQVAAKEAQEELHKTLQVWRKALQEMLRLTYFSCTLQSFGANHEMWSSYVSCLCSDREQVANFVRTGEGLCAISEDYLDSEHSDE